MNRTRYQTDAEVAATVAQTSANTVVGAAVAVTSEAATDLNTFSVEVVADIAAIKLELAALRVILGK